MRAGRRDKLEEEQFKSLVTALALYVAQEELPIIEVTKVLKMRALEESLKRYKGNQRQAARALNISDAVFHYYPGLRKKDG